jgi:membrane protein DedA with SNARE-associated domain
VFLGQFLGPLRATVPLVAGMSELEFLPFLVASISAALLWATFLLAFPALATGMF